MFSNNCTVCKTATTKRTLFCSFTQNKTEKTNRSFENFSSHHSPITTKWWTTGIVGSCAQLLLQILVLSSADLWCQLCCMVAPISVPEWYFFSHQFMRFWGHIGRLLHTPLRRTPALRWQSRTHALVLERMKRTWHAPERTLPGFEHW